MSKDTLAELYADILENDEFRDRVASDPSVLDGHDLTDEEREALIADASTEVSGFAMNSSNCFSVMQSGPPCNAASAARLGRAMNKASGNPAGAPDATGMVSTAGCCPWNNPAVG
jgi:hypothetical protein